MFQDIKWVISLFIELGFATQIVGNAREQLWGWNKNSLTNHDTLYQASMVKGIYSANSKGFLLLYFAFDKLLKHSFEHEPNTPFSEDMASISKVGCTHHFIIINFANGPYHGIHKDKGRPIHAIQTWSIAWIQRCKQGW